MVVFDIIVHVIPSVELSHCTTLPTLPDKVNVPVPLEQSNIEGKVPPTVVGFIVTVTVNVLPEQVPVVGVTV